MQSRLNSPSPLPSQGIRDGESYPKSNPPPPPPSFTSAISRASSAAPLRLKNRKDNRAAACIQCVMKGFTIRKWWRQLFVTAKAQQHAAETASGGDAGACIDEGVQVSQGASRDLMQDTGSCCGAEEH